MIAAVMSSHSGLHTDNYPQSPKERTRNASGSLRTALVITATVLVIELVGHMFTDVAALSLSFFAIRFATRPATPRKTYGFYRVEILAALLNGVVLVLISMFIFYEAYQRLMEPQPVRGNLMLLVASGGLLANLVSAYVLFRIQAQSLNVRGAFIHVLSDALGSIGAILASLAIIFFGWNSADAVISAIVAVLILSSSWLLIRDAVDVLLEGAPAHINLTTLKDNLLGAQEVLSVHDLHVWTLTSGVVAMSCHVVVGEDNRAQSDVLNRVREIVHKRFQIDHTTIQIENGGPNGEEFESCDCHFGAR
jgi:cobalt-zinc-cadmium efflux system protein